MEPLIYAGRAVSLLWGGFWLFFAIASAVDDSAHLLVGLVYAFGLGGVVFGTACAAWKWPRVGGMALVAEGLLTGSLMASGTLRQNSLYNTVFLLATLVLPPVAAGLMLLLGSGRRTSPT
jgi:hypothetical protein